MSVTEEQEEAMRHKYEALQEDGTPLERLRAHIMSRGVLGIKTIGVWVHLIELFEEAHIHAHSAVLETNAHMSAGVIQASFYIAKHIAWT